MGNYIVKPIREADFYVQFSTITDFPYFWGTRSAFMQAYEDEGLLTVKEVEELGGTVFRSAPRNLDRADKFGSSSSWQSLGFEQDARVTNWGGILFIDATKLQAALSELDPFKDHSELFGKEQFYKGLTSTTE